MSAWVTLTIAMSTVPPGKNWKLKTTQKTARKKTLRIYTNHWSWKTWRSSGTWRITIGKSCCWPGRLSWTGSGKGWTQTTYRKSHRRLKPTTSIPRTKNSNGSTSTARPIITIGELTCCTIANTSQSLLQRMELGIRLPIKLRNKFSKWG